MVTKKTTRLPRQGVYVSNGSPVYYDQNGEGIFGDIWRGVKKVGGFIKDKGLISKGLALAGRPGLSGAAKMLGFGDTAQPVMIVPVKRKKKKAAKKRKTKSTR
jgi:hypothetical protein